VLETQSATSPTLVGKHVQRTALSDAHFFHEPLAEPELPSFEIFGTRVHAIETAETMALLHRWIENPRERARYVAISAMHGVAEARKNSAFRKVLNSADLVVADGTPIVWIGRIKGQRFRRRVSGCDLVDKFCRDSGGAYRHFFYGGTDGSAERLARTLQEKFGIVIAGTYTPPFRPLTNNEVNELTTIVAKAAPDVLWVGLSSPKQEIFMYQLRDRLKVPVMLGVGAAFDLNNGNVRRAPAWMCDNGLEWLFRLCAEPRRLWRRYLVTIPTALYFVGLELLGFSRVAVADKPEAQE
jgi:N-acetylglucosaminyldiphosphoundecaprenol N-acetyl-beta-D-mannosaminyltransferase